MENAKEEYKACCEAVRALLKRHNEIIDCSLHDAEHWKKGNAKLIKNQDINNLIAFILMANAGFDSEHSLSEIGLQAIFGGGTFFHSGGVDLIPPPVEENTEGSK